MTQKRSVRKVVLCVVALLMGAIMLTSCQWHSEDLVVTVATPTPPSVIRLVENGDGIKDAYTNSHGQSSYEDVDLEAGMAVGQIFCSGNYTYSPTVGTASVKNKTVLSLSRCPNLVDGAKAQLVGTSVFYTFDCEDCTVKFSGAWEYGRDGVRAWRGLITVTPTGPSPALILYPLNLPS